MIHKLKLYATAMVSLALLDFVWIAFVMKSFYVDEMRTIGRINGDSFQPVLWAAVWVYLALSIALIQFVLPKLSAGSSITLRFATGALLGFAIYSTYDFTNYSTLKDWTIPLAIFDVAWGTFLCGTVTVLLCFLRDRPQSSH